MSGENPLHRLQAATRAAFTAARHDPAAPADQIDVALAGLGELTLEGETLHEMPAVVRQGLCDRTIVHPEARALHACLQNAAERLDWAPAFYPDDGYPDIPHFRNGYAFAMSVGDPRWAKHAITTSEKVGVSYTVQAPHTVYPDHAHVAVELYYVIAGKALWKRGGEPWVERYPGEVILHGTGMRHAMATGDEPLVACAIWISHTSAPVVVVRS
jgi:quercetin dioxygenase-like cupin family protein